MVIVLNFVEGSQMFTHPERGSKLDCQSNCFVDIGDHLEIKKARLCCLKIEGTAPDGQKIGQTDEYIFGHGINSTKPWRL